MSVTKTEIPGHPEERETWQHMRSKRYYSSSTRATPKPTKHKDCVGIYTCISDKPVMFSPPERVCSDGSRATEQVGHLRRSSSKLFPVDNRVTAPCISERDVLAFFGCMSLESYPQNEGTTSRLCLSVSAPHSLGTPVRAVGRLCCQDKPTPGSGENECLPSCLALRHGAFQNRMDAILSTPDERLHDLVRHLAAPAHGKHWPEHFAAAMLKLQCDVSGADYALRWRHCPEENGMTPVGFYVPLCREKQTEGETGTRAFCRANMGMVLESCLDSAVRRSHQSRKTILIHVATCDFFVRTEMAVRHGIQSICFRRDPQGDIVEFGSQSPDWERQKRCCMLEYGHQDSIDASIELQ